MQSLRRSGRRSQDCHMISCNIFCSIVDLILVLTGLELASGKGTKDILPLLMSNSLLLRYWIQFFSHIM